MTTFPEGFLFGTAQSAHQVEGGNVNSDWWAWEHAEGSPCVEPSGDACDFYHRYRDDLALMAELGLNALRFGIEWARIEPEEGEFSTAALDHYRRVLLSCHEHEIAPLVTFHHFTLPRWLQAKGGFLFDRFPALFARYCEHAAAALGDLIAYACTINEPEGLGEGGYILGVNPPGRKGDVAAMWRVAEQVLEAHRLGAAAIRSRAKIPVGVTLALPDLQYEDGALPGERHVELNAQVSERFFELARDDDFVGVQTYTRNRFGPEGPRGPHVDWSQGLPEETSDTTQLGQEYYPQALGNTIRRAWQRTGGTPILVTESGIATTFDEKRISYTDAALREVLACLAAGIEVRSYLYWSLLDNFEWSLGYEPKFGMVAVDRGTFARHPKPSAYWFGAVARAQSLPDARKSQRV
jgi:beta-glucosidase